MQCTKHHPATWPEAWVDLAKDRKKWAKICRKLLKADQAEVARDRWQERRKREQAPEFVTPEQRKEANDRRAEELQLTADEDDSETVTLRFIFRRWVRYLERAGSEPLLALSQGRPITAGHQALAWYVCFVENMLLAPLLLLSLLQLLLCCCCCCCSSLVVVVVAAVAAAALALLLSLLLLLLLLRLRLRLLLPHSDNSSDARANRI